MIKIMSTFSGVSGLELELDKKKFKVVGFSELYPSACDILDYLHPKVKNYGDITKIKIDELPDFDMLTGGTPCQNFSMAGNRQGLKGAKSSLFFHYLNILEKRKPKYFLWENVKGALSSSNGHDLLAVLKSFINLGYNIQYQVVNSKDLGLAQSRTRLFVFGSLTNEFPPILELSPREIKSEKIRFNNFGGTIQNKGIINTLTRTYGPNQGDSPKYAAIEDLEAALTQNEVRLFSPLECERLMGWPDNHTKYGLKSGKKYEIKNGERTKACGNGIASICLQNLNKKFKPLEEIVEAEILHGKDKFTIKELLSLVPTEKIYWPKELAVIKGKTYKSKKVKPSKIKDETIEDIIESSSERLTDTQIAYLRKHKN